MKKITLVLTLLFFATAVTSIAEGEPAPKGPAGKGKPQGGPSGPGGPGGPGRPGGPGGPGGPRRPERPKFEEVDANKDGKITPEEFGDFSAQRARERAKQFFRALDKNKDKELTKEEFKMPPRPGGQRPGKGGPPQKPNPGGGTQPKRPPVEE